MVISPPKAGTGGTWAGATETLENGWAPVFVLEHADMPDENRELLKKGGLPFPHPFAEPPLRLPEWLAERSVDLHKPSSQMTLF